MDKKRRKLARIFIGIFPRIICIIICLYSILWIYINYKRDNEAIENYKQKINVTLTDEQAKIVWFSYTNNKKYGFTWVPLFFEIFQTERRNNIDFITGTILIGDSRKYSSMEYHFVSYSMKRYVNRKISWKECIEILVSNLNFGNQNNGIKKGSEYYYNKPYENLTEKELIGLTIIERRPNIEFNSNDFINEIEKIYNSYKSGL
jgi:hypothetical protein